MTQPDHQQTLDEVQSHILRSMDPQRAVFVFFRIVDLANFRAFLERLVTPRQRQDAAPQPDDPQISSETEQIAPSDGGRKSRKRRQFTWNIAFTYPGLCALEIDGKTLQSFPVEFQEGMASRAHRLGDIGESDPENWESWLGSRLVHGLLWLNLRHETDWTDSLDARAEKLKSHVDQAAEAIKSRRSAYGIEILHEEFGHNVVDNGQRVEHFGFRDGISQPFARVVLEDRPQLSPPSPGGGTRRPDGSWAPIAPGELLLGRPDEDGVTQDRPNNELLRNNGTYLVFRKLEQDVVSFRRFIEWQEGRPFTGQSQLAAQMVGRWADGSPLERVPDGPGLPPGNSDVNDFGYESDPAGDRCPIGAHIRRANPRDTNNRDEARRHRIWRRAISYGGDFIPYGSSGDGRRRGLLFMALNARIDQQFEFVQSRWLNGGEFVGQAGVGRCPILGTHSGKTQDSFFAPGRPAPYTHLPRFVKMRGGDYFFVPSIQALKVMASEKNTFPPDIRPQIPAEMGESNPSIDTTPSPLDVQTLLRLGKDKLLPSQDGQPRANVDRYQGVVLVGQHKDVCTVLENDQTYAVSDYDARIRRITGNQPLIIGLPKGDPVRDLRLSIWRAGVMGRNGPDTATIVAGAMQSLLARFVPTGKLELVEGVGSAVALALARYYYGVVGPPWLSPTFIASVFCKLDLTQVPSDWQAALPPIAQQDWPDVTLRAWLLYPFMQVFENVVNDRDIADLAERLTAELFRHLRSLFEAAMWRQSQAPGYAKPTVLDALAALQPPRGLTDDQFVTEVCLLLAEFMAAGLRTLSQALPNIVDQLLVGDRMNQAKAAQNNNQLDAVIREALRFDPVSPVLFRRCAQPAALGQSPVAVGELVAVLTKTAMFDPAVFTQPDNFDPTRPQNIYLHFGPQPPADAPHACLGAQPANGTGMAVVAIREMLKPLLALKNLRLAAGPAAQQRDPFGCRQRYLVRFDP
jgi:Dyp-type peroxidase family